MRLTFFLIILMLTLPFTSMIVNSESNEEQKPLHGVLSELFVTTTCTNCPDSEEDLVNIQKTENMFYFISFVMDENDEADERADDYGVMGVPVAEFDGINEVIGSGKKAVYENTIQDLRKNRKDIKIFVKMDKVNSTTIGVSISIFSNESSSTSYQLRAYVVEKESRYKNEKNENIPNAFIGYAFNENVNINPGWYNDSATFTDENASFSNLVVVASLFQGKIAIQTASSELAVMQISGTQSSDFEKFTVNTFIAGQPNSVQLEFTECTDDVCGLPQTTSMIKVNEDKYTVTIGPLKDDTTKVTCNIIVKNSDYEKEANVDIYVSQDSSSANGDKENDEGGIPGFEAFGLFIAVMLILGWKKRKK